MICAALALATLLPALSPAPAPDRSAGDTRSESPIDDITGLALSGCGQVVATESCGNLFKFFDHEGLFLVGDLSAYADGDVLLVTGKVCLTCLLVDCGIPYTALITDEIKSCNFGGPEDFVFVSECVTALDSACGQVLYNEETGVQYDTDVEVIFVPGTHLRVEGIANLAFATLCPEDATISVNLQVSDFSACGADLNFDGSVDGADLGLLLSDWGACRSCDSDLDGDGQVNGSDLGLLLAEWTT